MTDEERINLVLSEMVKDKRGLLHVQKFLIDVVKDEDQISYQRIRSDLVNMGFAKSIFHISELEILPLGREIVKTGGYLKFLEKLELDKKEAERLRRIENEDALLKLKLNTFYFKWRWVPFVLSAFALAISILVAIFK